MSSLLDDLISRLQGMPADEKQEIVQAAVDATRHMKWIPNPGPQTDAYFSDADILLYGGQGGGGKALDIDTPLPTPTGWTTMGEVQVGDLLFDEQGRQCRVVGVTPLMKGRPCYRVRFSDGSELVADAEHGWLTMTAKERYQALCATPEWRARRRAKRPSRAKEVSQKPWVSKIISRINSERAHNYLAAPTGSVRTTEEIANTLMHRKALNHSVVVAAAVQCDQAQLPIDPYVLGAWLGDGSSYKAEITSVDQEILDAIAGYGYVVAKRPSSAISYGLNGGLLVSLKHLGLIANKHIPPAYLRGSEGQRLALLQGLMDTDGHCDNRGQCEFVSVRRTLADGVHELLLSLGIKAVVRTGVAKLKGRTIGPKYTIKFITEKPAFRLSRKLIRQKRSNFRGTHDRRYIVSVDRIPSVTVRCIEVDSPSHLYLAGRSMVPTHNSDLGLGLAFTAHQRSLIMRRKYANLAGLTERALKINGSRNGFNGSPPPLLRTEDGRYIQFAGNQHAGDEQDWQGIPFDLKYFDEATQFLESQVRFHLGWLRLADGEQEQRTRAVLGTNPPVDADGDWIIGMFRPWLDLTHPRPAKHGELRWFVTAEDGSDIEMADADLGRDRLGRAIHKTMVKSDGSPLLATSRSFIPAKLSDNPFLVNTNYGANLDGLPEPLRSAVRDGNFMAARQDAEWQVIPTAWIIAAQARWKEDGYKAFAMTAMGFDPAGGGRDSAELAYRHGGWYGRIISATGDATADGSAAAATVIRYRRDAAPVVIDVGGGYGGAVTQRLADNGVFHVGFNGAERAVGRTKDGQLGFVNRRAQAWWRFREELDPDQEGGSAICLPPDPELRADLAAPVYMVKTNGIQIESKDELRKRLGRSPGKGDAVVMALDAGNAAQRRMRNRNGGSLPKYANMGHSSVSARKRFR